MTPPVLRVLAVLFLSAFAPSVMSVAVGAAEPAADDLGIPRKSLHVLRSPGPALRAETQERDPADQYWQSGFGEMGFDGPVYVALDYQGTLVVGGMFTHIGEQAVNSIAQWNGYEWTSLSEGMTGGWVPAVRALAVWNGVLVAGGAFTHAGGVQVNNIAKWNGHAWSAMGGSIHGVDGDVLALCPTDSCLFVGGRFWSGGGDDLSYMARYDGSSFEAVGGGTSGTVYDIEPYLGGIVVAGRFGFAGGVVVNNVARWNDVSWSSMGGGLVGASAGAYRLATYHGNLIVGGHFSVAGSLEASNIAGWDGLHWSALGTGIHDESAWVYALEVHDGSLVAGGWFSGAGDADAANLARWDGDEWTGDGQQWDGTVLALLDWGDGLVAGGSFFQAGNSTAPFLAMQRGENWRSLVPRTSAAPPRGMNDWVLALTEYRGALVAGGQFTRAGASPAQRIASWDGSSWSPLGAGADATIFTLTEYDGDLIAAGAFTHIGDVEANHIARWDGSQWSPLGEGLDGLVSAVTVLGDDLVVGGNFTAAGQQSANFIASWDGAEWAPLGAGLDDQVYSLAAHDGGIAAGGAFTHAGGVEAHGVALWKDGEWHSVGTGTEFESPIESLTVFQGDLVVSGLPVGFPSGVIARWTATGWQAFGTGINGSVISLAEHQGGLVAAGVFNTISGHTTKGIARWDGYSWRPLGSGVTGGSFPGAWALQSMGDDLFVGGSFLRAGDQPSFGVARWNVATRTTDAHDCDEWVTDFRVDPQMDRGLPFVIRYSLPSKGRVLATVHDVLGRSVVTLCDVEASSGRHLLSWSGRDNANRPVPTGVYLVTLAVRDRAVSRKIIWWR